MKTESAYIQPFYRVTKFVSGADDFDLIASHFNWLKKKKVKCFIIMQQKLERRKDVPCFSTWAFGREVTSFGDTANNEELPEDFKVVAAYGCQDWEIRNATSLKPSEVIDVYNEISWFNRPIFDGLQVVEEEG